MTDVDTLTKIQARLESVFTSDHGNKIRNPLPIHVTEEKSRLNSQIRKTNSTGTPKLNTNQYQRDEICSPPQPCTFNPKIDHKLHLTILRPGILSLDNIPNPLTIPCQLLPKVSNCGKPSLNETLMRVEISIHYKTIALKSQNP